MLAPANALWEVSHATSCLCPADFCGFVIALPGIAQPRTPRAASPTRRLQTDQPSAATPSDRSPGLGMAVSALVRLAGCPSIRATAYRHQLAAETLSGLLAAPESAGDPWPAGPGQGRP